MRSRAERIARGLALGLVAWLLAQAFRAAPRPLERAAGGALAEALVRWSTVAAPGEVHADLAGSASPASADWLAALAASATAVGWAGPAQAIAVTADPVADPAGGTRVLVAAPRGALVVVEDRWGALDSTTAGNAGVRFLARSAPAAVRAHAGSLSAWSSVQDTLSLGRVLIVGHAGWESKFVAAALEERGWRVDLDLALSPRGDVVQGRAAVPDVATHAALVVLDTTAASRAPAIARFVISGGGLVMAAPALASPALAALSPGVAGEMIAPVEPYDTGFADPRRSLGLAPLRPRADAVALEQRGPSVAVAARRVGRGRVAVVGYEDTWRWRLAGARESPEDHRAWWAALVASVAHAPSSPRPAAGPMFEAPLSQLTDRLGPPSAAPAAVPPARALEPWLFALLAAAFLFEWASRRLRGAA